MIRRFRLSDAQATRAVFVAAVRQGAAPRHTFAELDGWLPDPAITGAAMPEDWGTRLDGHITFVADEGPAGITGIEGLDPRQGPDDNPVNRAMALTL